MSIIYGGSVFAGPLPNNGHLFWLGCSTFQASCCISPSSCWVCMCRCRSMFTRLLFSIGASSASAVPPFGCHVTIFFCQFGLSVKFRLAATSTVSWFQFPLLPMTTCLLFSGVLLVSKWDLIFDKGRCLTTTGHTLSVGG
jgi:hypothetical protein